ncbi:C6 zinc finger domain protein [Aspergillus nomiae NRRL 13137]|uniref:C6 zinc finger domain protein n=1 Tax=Aspergillus nomiae NRRL (strain ATCC 15546 / NRRL 13137 / CBS 260.88 / M93) TaxID=1509407 RepID=A0A0L1JAZ0_ASPN3|nr:C6 zinc finger domain protein [Aspergillus nomiae NRRL 13137]KNG88892.1 C6 zinc finger domain protein [Aspergillus nomiae NRRL 13137]
MHELLQLHIQPNPGPLGDITQGPVPGQQIPIPSPSHIMSDPGPMPTFPGTAETGEYHYRGPRCIPAHRNGSIFQELQPAEVHSPHPARQRRSGFDVREEPISDFISKGLMTIDHAMSCFRAFFQGCDRYIPIFDPELDNFASVRARSSILLNAICTIGSRVETRSGSQISDLLHAELKRWINVVIQNKTMNCLESVQALLIVACYSAERSLLLSFATRMALDLSLDEAFEDLIQRLTMKEVEGISEFHMTTDEEERSLMRKSRTWFGLLVLDHIFHVDGGKPPGIRMTGNAHRCRILLRHHTSTVLDLRLFSQVELNVIRAKINDTLDAKETLDRPDIAEFVHEAKVDLDLWFDDWLRIIESSIAAEQERPFLLAALRVQKCWAELILHCKALLSMGVENVAAMSPVERNILLLAKSSARKHLRLISTEPDFYLAKLKYAMDFVWAKCAFCFLLLLKLSRLLPERREEHQELLDHGNRLLDELTRSVGSSGETTGNGSIYMQILRLSIEKYGRIFQEREAGGDPVATAPFWESFDAQADLQSFVPEQFVREWDFPGLNLFYFPTAWQDFFGDFSLAV